MQRKLLFRIEMKVPLGVRRGALELDVDGKNIGGTLTMFAHTTEICSVIMERGNVEFSGLMKTLGYSMNYIARGTLNRHGAELDFETEKGTYHAVGRPFHRDRGQEDFLKNG